MNIPTPQGLEKIRWAHRLEIPLWISATYMLSIVLIVALATARQQEWYSWHQMKNDQGYEPVSPVSLIVRTGGQTCICIKDWGAPEKFLILRTESSTVNLTQEQSCWRWLINVAAPGDYRHLLSIMKIRNWYQKSWSPRGSSDAEYSMVAAIWNYSSIGRILGSLGEKVAVMKIQMIKKKKKQIWRKTLGHLCQAFSVPLTEGSTKQREQNAKKYWYVQGSRSIWGVIGGAYKDW